MKNICESIKFLLSLSVRVVDDNVRLIHHQVIQKESSYGCRIKREALSTKEEISRSFTTFQSGRQAYNPLSMWLDDEEEGQDYSFPKVLVTFRR